MIVISSNIWVRIPIFDMNVRCIKIDFLRRYNIATLFLPLCLEKFGYARQSYRKKEKYDT